ncbi:MAG TPA: hypothetical protein VJK54_11840 [Chthoniobacterales bacterium]|nr:hypothetical protein [Chthoniobacterales bacterium]
MHLIEQLFTIGLKAYLSDLTWEGFASPPKLLRLNSGLKAGVLTITTFWIKVLGDGLIFPHSVLFLFQLPRSVDRPTIFMITDHPISMLVEEPIIMNDEAYKAKLIAGIEEARAEFARGEFFTLEEVEKEIPSWIIR